MGAVRGMKYAGLGTSYSFYFVFFKITKGSDDWNNSSSLWIKAGMLEISTSELQKKVFVFNNL